MYSTGLGDLDGDGTLEAFGVISRRDGGQLAKKLRIFAASIYTRATSLGKLRSPESASQPQTCWLQTLGISKLSWPTATPRTMVISPVPAGVRSKLSLTMANFYKRSNFLGGQPDLQCATLTTMAALNSSS